MTPTEEADFRERCRRFLAEHGRPAGRSNGAEPAVEDERDDAEELGRCRSFQQARVDAGLAALPYPAEFGGAGLTPRHDEIWREEASGWVLPTRLLSISHGMCLPVLNEFGSEEQKRRHMADVISARELWCQMFSEPGAGSDVASLQTRAVRDGDEWVLNGQKVWTTYAHLCERGLVVARTNPDVPKHRGLSMFLVDLRAPGVEVRPLRQLTGKAEFNEVFFTDVRLPADALVGPLNEGWRVATAMLMYERVSIGSGAAGDITHARADLLIEEARRRGLTADPMIRQRLVHLYSGEVCQSLLALQTQAAVESGKAPGPGGSLGKLMGAGLAAEMRDLTFTILGLGATAPTDERAARLTEQALQSLASGIAGGTNEIQRNIIGERVLGLPREPSVDKDIPFKELRLSAAR